MYDLIDRPIDTLPAFERSVLAKVRRWTHAFAIAGAEASTADDALSVALHALDEGSSQDIVIQRPCFATVDETEAVIVSLWRMVRDRRAPAARALAAGLVAPAYVGTLLDGIDRMIAAD